MRPALFFLVTLVTPEENLKGLEKLEDFSIRDGQDTS